MATTFVPSAGNIVRPYGKSRLKHYPEDAAQSFKRGEPVILGGAGLENKIKVASDNPTAAIVGIAAADASGVTGAMCPVWLAQPELRFQAHTVTAVAIDFTTIGAARAIQKHGTLAIWVVDVGDAGNDSVVVEEFHDPVTNATQTVEGDFEAYVIFHFDPKATVFGAGT